MSTNSVNKALQGLMKDLSDRQREVLYGRFGLNKEGRSETLESLGKRFGVTRERVRQIEASALIALKERMLRDSAVAGLISESKKFLKTVGGVARKEDLLGELSKTYGDANAEQLALILAATGEFYAHDEDKDFYAFYALDKSAEKNAQNFIQQWVAALRAEKKSVLPGGYENRFRTFVKAKATPANSAEHYVSVSKKIHQNPFGDTGLAEWPEIKPKTIRDRIYLVLKKEGKPVHFESIAQLINTARFDARPALASTVHNELIKDPRFVLVGRGMYGLAEQGYERGTAREVIQKVLKKHGPMRSKDIVSVLQKERFFKYNTILVNLQNRAFFERRADGTYQVKES